MKTNKIKALIVLIIYSVMIMIIGGFIGYRIASDKTSDHTDSCTFYAEVTEVNETNINVQGIEYNDINHRGQFSISLDDSTPISWRNESQSIDSIKPGSHIAITYSGSVLETYPAQIEKVDLIQILDD